MNNHSQSGQAIIIVILIVMVFLILIPLNVFFLDQETKFSMLEKQTTTAFHCAEQGADRGYWKLLEKPGYWASVGAGGTIEGYCFDKVYVSTYGGSYTISITTTDDSKERKIISIGKSSDGKELRAVEIIFRKSSIEGAIQAKGITTWGNMHVHWGPMLATTQMSPTSDAYPVMRCKLGVSGSAGTCAWGDDLGRPDITPPQSNSTAFCSHAWYPAGWYQWQNFDTDVQDTSIDLVDLKQQAATQGRYYTTGAAGDGSNINDSPGMPAGTSYATYLASYYSPAIVRYFDLGGGTARAKFSGNTYLEGTLIVTNGNLELTGNDAGDYWWPVPADAWKQYCAINTAAASEFPGDAAGAPTATSAFQDAQYRFTGTHQVTMHGIIYVKNGDVKITGNISVHGAIIVENGNFSGGGCPTIYYDPAVADYAGFEGTIQRTSWKEIKMEWPAGL